MITLPTIEHCIFNREIEILRSKKAGCLSVITLKSCCSILRDSRNEFQPGNSIAFERVSRWLHRVIHQRVTRPLLPSTRVDAQNFFNRSLIRAIDKRVYIFAQANTVYFYIFIAGFNRTCSYYLQSVSFAGSLDWRRYHCVSTFFHLVDFKFLAS